MSVSQSNFRLQNKFVMLTYKTHLDKNNFLGWLEELISPTYKLKSAEIAHETGDENCPYEHTHVVIEFNKALQTRNCRKFDYENIHPHIQPIKGRSGFKKALGYISKEDPECEHLRDQDFSNVVIDIWKCESIHDVLLKCKQPSDVIPYLKLFEHKFESLRDEEYKKKISNLTLRDYQQEWLDTLKNQDDYKVFWVVDYKGGMGKSTFCKYMCVNYDAIKLQNGKGNDLLHGYKGQEYVLFDLSRTCEERLNYQAIEDIKNGHVFSGKYDSKMKFFAPPKIIIFSNFYPDRSALSKERWNIKEYNTDYSLML